MKNESQEIGNQSAVYFKGLNGLRAIAAIAVIVGHLFTAMKKINPEFDLGLDLGNFAVTIFFALSGFLITSLILLETDISRTVNIKDFYIRRILRIWPIYYLYIAICIICVPVLTETSIWEPSLICYLAFGANLPFIFGTGLLCISHLLSIGVEEQFYAFWPWLFRKVKNIGVKLWILLIGLMVFRIVGYVFLKQFDFPWMFRFIHVLRFDCMAIGGIAALLFHKKSKWVNFLASWPAQIFSWTVLSLITIGKFRMWMLFDHQIVAISTVCIILSNIAIKKPIINLENRVFNFFGKISYGLYVYHPLVIIAIITFIENAKADVELLSWFLFVTAMVASILISYLSYKFIEKPMLQLKKKFSLVKSSNEFVTAIDTSGHKK